MPDFLIPIDYADRHGLGQVPLSLIYLQIDRMLAEGHLTAIDLVICWLRNVALGANVVYFVLDIEGFLVGQILQIDEKGDGLSEGVGAFVVLVLVQGVVDSDDRGEGIDFDEDEVCELPNGTYNFS